MSRVLHKFFFKCKCKSNFEKKKKNKLKLVVVRHECLLFVFATDVTQHPREFVRKDLNIKCYRNNVFFFFAEGELSPFAVINN